MITKEHPTENSDELALVKAAAWTWYQNGPGSEKRTVSESDYTGLCDIVLGPSRYKLEAMNTGDEDTKASTRYTNNPLFSTDHAESSLLDVYEIERISKDLECYIESSWEEYYCRRSSVNSVHVPSGPRIVPLPERDSSGAKATRTSKQKNWFRKVYKLCGLNKGDVVENVGLATERRRANKKQISVVGDAYLPT